MNILSRDELKILMEKQSGRCDTDLMDFEEIPDSQPLAAVFRHERRYPEPGHKSVTRGTSKKS